MRDVVDPVRDFFELVPLSWFDFALIGSLAAVWAGLVMLTWRTRLVDRGRLVVMRLLSRRQGAHRLSG